MRKSQLLLTSSNDDDHHGNGNGNGNNAGSESYSSSSSFTESYSDSSDLANWEEYVAENGTLFYAEYSPISASRRPHEKRIEFARNSSLRLGKKSGAAGRKQHQQTGKEKQQQQKQQQLQNNQQQDDFKFSQMHQRGGQEQLQQQKQLELVITAADRYRFGRRSTAVESILGFRVVPYSDQPECLMVDSFVHDMPAMQQQLPPIKRGDWFKSLDDIEVHTSNIDELLLQFIEPTKVCLKFQGPDIMGSEHNAGTVNNSNDGAGIAGGSNDLRRIENFAMFAENFEKFQRTSNTNTDGCTIPLIPFSLLILPPECYQNEEHRDSMFVYPELGGNNFLYKSRGSFLTLNAVLGAEMQTKPISSKILVDNIQYYVCFRTLNSFLVLFAYAAAYQSMMEANLRSDELISYMRFSLPNLSLEQLSSINSLSSLSLPLSLSSSLRQFLYHFCTIQRTRILSKHSPRIGKMKQVCLFEELLKESRSLPLPKEAQLRIFDALSEMEAMDYRNWNDEPLNTHREFFIHGSVLYYDHFLLAVQMPLEMRMRVEGFLRCRGIFDFITDQCVKELYVWEEIIPPESEHGHEMGRFFLTVCSRSHLILAVVLKIFDAPDLAPDAIIPPSLFYIEEIQETLDHLILCGIESLAMFWSISNKRPETLSSLDSACGIDGDCFSGSGPVNEKDSKKLENFIKQKLTPSSIGSQSQRSISYDEETHLCSSLGGSSIHSLTQSEDDSSRKRLMSTGNNGNNDNASDSGSDWDNFGEQNPLHYGIDGEFQTQMTESLWKEINNVIPVKISTGWKNAVFHYVYVDNANGTVFCPLKSVPTPVMNNSSGSGVIGGSGSGGGGSGGGGSGGGGSGGGGGVVNNNIEVFPFLSEIRKACLIIHNVLQSTKSFKRLLAQEPIISGNSNHASTNVVTASNRLIGLAIKEHSITIKIEENTEEDGGSASSAIFKGSFVVVGRLFHTPMREVYVCHRPDVPQNMVEMAFRLSFFSVG